MDTANIYSKLSLLPLFTGLGVEDLKRIIGKTKIEFLRYAEGETFARQGDKCGRLLILIDGSMTCVSTAEGGCYKVTENISAPAVIQLDGIFGLFQQFTHTMTATTPISLISIDKNELLKLASSSLILRLNLINSLSTKIQKIRNEMWRRQPDDLSARIVKFFNQHCLTPSGHKTFHIKMLTLAHELSVARLEVSQALNDMQTRGLISLYRGRIEIPAMQHLLGNT